MLLPSVSPGQLPSRSLYEYVFDVRSGCWRSWKSQVNHPISMPYYLLPEHGLQYVSKVASYVYLEAMSTPWPLMGTLADAHGPSAAMCAAKLCRLLLTSHMRCAAPHCTPALSLDLSCVCVLFHPSPPPKVGPYAPPVDGAFSKILVPTVDTVRCVCTL